VQKPGIFASFRRKEKDSSVRIWPNQRARTAHKKSRPRKIGKQIELRAKKVSSLTVIGGNRRSDTLKCILASLDFLCKSLDDAFGYLSVNTYGQGF